MKKVRIIKSANRIYSVSFGFKQGINLYVNRMDGGIDMAVETNRSVFWQGIIIGGTVAAVSALLYAPKAGITLRKKIYKLFQLNKPLAQPRISVKHTMNSMAQNESDMAKLGEEMKHMKTNTQVTNSGMVPDPIQNE